MPLKRILQWGLGLLLLLLLLFILGDISQLRRLPEISWGYVIILFLCNVGFTLSHNFRWKEILDNLSGPRRTDFYFLYRSLVDSYALGKIIPMDVSLVVLRSYHLKRFQGIPVSIALFSVLLDRFLDIVLLFLMALPAFLLITKTVSELEALFILILLLIGQGFIILWKKGDTFRFLMTIYRSLIARWFLKIPFLGGRMQGEMGGTDGGDHFNLLSVTHITIWNVVKYVFLSLRFYFTGRALGVMFPWLQGFFFLPFIQLSGIINVTPGGLGILELGTYGALVFMGIPESQILLFVFGQRILLTFIFLALFCVNRIFYFFRSKWKGTSGFDGRHQCPLY